MNRMLHWISPVAPRSLAVVSTCILASTASGAFAQEGIENFPLSQGLNDEWRVHALSTDRPASDWNHFDMKVAETTIRSIMPNYITGDPVNIEQMNRFNKHLVAESVLVSTGQIGTWLQDETLVAVEFAVLDNDPFPAPGENERLSTVGIIEGIGLDGQYGILGTMYCYDQAQYDARIAVLVAIMGRDPNRPTVWLGDTLQSAASGSKSMRLLGSGNTVVGSVHSNGDLRIGGDAHVMLQQLDYVGMLMMGMGSYQLGPRTRVPAKVLPTPAHDAAWYQAAATANGTYFAGNISICDDGQGGLMSLTGVALSGVVYATGDITIDSNGLTGNVTLVAQGAIDFGASNCLLTAAQDDLLVWSTSTTVTDAISLDGSGCVLTGAVYGPCLEFRVGGSSNQLSGRVLADGIKITGSLNTLTDGTK